MTENNEPRVSDFSDRPSHALLFVVEEMRESMDHAKTVSEEIKESLRQFDGVMTEGARRAVEEFFAEQIKRFDHDRKPYGAIQRLRAAGEVVIEDITKAIDTSAVRAASRITEEIKLPIEMAVSKAVTDHLERKIEKIAERAAEKAILRTFSKLIPRLQEIAAGSTVTGEV